MEKLTEDRLVVEVSLLGQNISFLRAEVGEMKQTLKELCEWKSQQNGKALMAPVLPKEPSIGKTERIIIILLIVFITVLGIWGEVGPAIVKLLGGN